LWLDFPTTLIVFPSRLSHLTVPAVDLSHSLAFDSLSPCEAVGVLRFARYPCVIRANTEPPGCLPPTPGSYNHRGASLPKPLCGRSGPAGFSTTFADSHPVLLLPRGRPDRCCKPYDTAFDRFAPMSSDHVLGFPIAGMHATPIPRSGTVLPNLSSGSCGDSRSFEQAFRLSFVRLSSTSRFPSANFQPRGISGPSRPGDSFGFITCRLLWSASYPCRLSRDSAS